MQIAIQKNNAGFTRRWINYCRQEGIPFKLVNVFSPSFLNEIEGCEGFMWHLSHENHQDVLSGYAIVKSLEERGIVVYPTTNQLWHFDDKLSQGIFFKFHQICTPKTNVIFSKKEGISFLDLSDFPLIAKLKRGSASSNVFLLNDKKEAKGVIRKSFGKGFSLYNLSSRYGDRFRKVKSFREGIELLFKYVYRLLYPPDYARFLGREKGYLLFQEYVPNKGFDIRVVVVGDRLVSLKRLNRKDDFRASGSGKIEFPNEHLGTKYRELAFQTFDKLKVPAMGFDFIEDLNGKVYLIEISFGFPSENFLDGASGYWTREGEFVNSKIKLQEWMLDWVLIKIKSKSTFS